MRTLRNKDGNGGAPLGYVSVADKTEHLCPCDEILDFDAVVMASGSDRVLF
jgi:hypothetical protein